MKRIKAAILRWARPVSTPVGELFRYLDDYGHPASYAKCRECGWDVYFEPLDTIQKWNFCANCGTGLDWRAFESGELTPEASGAIDKLDALAALLESGEPMAVSKGEYRVPFSIREGGGAAAEGQREDAP